MPKPNPIPGCPPGLEYLTQIDTLKMKQATELFESIYFSKFDLLFIFFCNSS
jgi:hypothetical protein